ncbi:5-hydroxytryptamine receptor 2A-like [Drosophila eugracilis]|uniref:5-hydroxytryptamine receptor 2A-like n=1 Tax=Drosophila eugracilis TaxID=29029 RepID=UPI001BD9EACF|nr:5-hydroxytryptamine receptor 2A-like [Drosophila eugracilis]
MEEDVYASLGAYNDSGGEEDWASSEHLVLWGEELSGENASNRHNQLQLARWNVSNATIMEDVPFDANNYWALLALVLVLGTAAGNILVCLAIAWERRLQNVTNYFLMSLAITDLMVAVLVMPLGILTLVKGESFVLFKNLNRGIFFSHPLLTKLQGVFFLDLEERFAGRVSGDKQRRICVTSSALSSHFKLTVNKHGDLAANLPGH